MKFEVVGVWVCGFWDSRFGRDAKAAGGDHTHTFECEPETGLELRLGKGSADDLVKLNHQFQMELDKAMQKDLYRLF